MLGEESAPRVSCFLTESVLFRTESGNVLFLTESVVILTESIINLTEVVLFLPNGSSFLPSKILRESLSLSSTVVLSFLPLFALT